MKHDISTIGLAHRGWSYSIHLQRVVNEYFIGIADLIANRDDVHIPLVEYAKDHRTDAALQRFLGMYRWNMERYSWLMGQRDVPGDLVGHELVSVLTSENKTQPLPVVNMQHFDLGGQRFAWERTLFPFGERHILEAIAFLMEREYLRRIAPAQVDRFERSVLSAPTGWQYALPLFLMQSIVGDASADRVAQACEFALCLPREPLNSQEIHPGWRYVALLQALRETGDRSALGIMQAASNLCQKENWRQTYSECGHTPVFLMPASTTILTPSIPTPYLNHRCCVSGTLIVVGCCCRLDTHQKRRASLQRGLCLRTLCTVLRVRAALAALSSTALFRASVRWRRSSAGVNTSMSNNPTGPSASTDRR
jgi:hypothetical protein